MIIILNQVGEYNTYDGKLNLAFFDTGSSLGFLGNRSIMKLNEIDPKTEYGTLYATASVEDGIVQVTKYLQKYYNLI